MPPERTIEQALSCCDQDSEVNVLGAIIQEGRLINEVQDLKPKDFYLQKHQEVFKVMLEMKKHSVPIDITTLLADIRDRGLEEKIGGSPYLTHLVETTPTTATIRYHAERIKDAANVRTAVKGLTQLVLNGKGKSEEIREGLEKLIMDLGPRSGSLFEFKTISWQELVGQEEPEIEFLIEDLLPAACLLILAGKPKLGKSLLALLIALSVSLGKPLWGKKVNQGGVLFISTEDGIIRLKKRIWKMIGSPDKETPNFHFYLGDCILTRQGVMEALREKIQTLKPKLIVLDPFINLFRGRELNSAEDMNEVLRPLQELAKDTGACVLVIHHVRKSAGNDSIDIIQGSITIGGVPDGILLLRNLSAGTKEKKAVLEVTLKDAEVPNKLVLKLDDNLRWTVEGDFEEITRRSIEEKIIRALSEVTDGLPIKSLEQITGYGYMPIYRCLGKLEEDNRIFSKPKGRSHTKFYFLKNEVKNENSPVASGNYSNKDHERSLLIKSLLRETQSYRKRDKEIADAERRISLIIRQRLKKT